MIRGQTITLYLKSQTGVDAFNRPIYTDNPVSVDNVLIAPMSDQEILDTLNLTGRRAVYQLGIPKGDTHEWENQRVRFFGQDWRVIGHPTEGMENNIPLKWNKKVRVESYSAE